MDNLEAAISRAELAVSTTPEDHPDRAEWLDDLENRLFNRYNETGNMHELDVAISKAELAVSTTPENHPNQAKRLNTLGLMLLDRYNRTANMHDLEAAVLRLELAVSATPENHPDRATLLSNLGNMLSEQYIRTGDMHDLEVAISRAELAVSATSENDPARAGRLSNLGTILLDRYNRTGNMNDLEAAISKAELAVLATPEDHPDRAEWLSNLGNMLSYRYDRTGNMHDLEAAFSKAELAFLTTSENHSDRARRLDSLAKILSDRYNRTGNMLDLEAAILKAELAVSITPENHSGRATHLSNLGNILSDRYNRTGNMNDLEAAISKAELAVSIAPENDPYRITWLSHLGNRLADRYKRTGNIHDLEAAISKAELAVSASPEDHPDQAILLYNLGLMLSLQYNQTGNMHDLEAAISKAELAILATPEDHPDRAGRLNSLGNMLSERYDRTGNMYDLEAAISKAELAVSTTPEDHPSRAGRLSDLGVKLSARYNRTRNMNDLEAAISRAELGVSATPENHPDRAGRLNNLGNMRSDRYNHTGNMYDLEAAISDVELAISTTPEDHPNQPKLLNSLGGLLSDRFYQTGNIHNLEAAISKAELVVSTVSEDHPDMVKYLNNLGKMLSDRYNQTKNIHDLETALKSFIRSFNLLNAIPLIRIIGARRAIRILVSMENWDQASSLAHAAIKLLPFICGRYLSREDQQYAILQISGLAADACSLSLKVGHVHQALQQLEFGRGIILGYLMDSRSDLTQLQKDYPDLANRYETFRFKAYAHIEAMQPVLREKLLKERQEAAISLEDCLRRIRQEQGYERFLLEPTVHELQQCANEGPIVIVNVTDIRCDAIIVSTAEIQAIALPEMNSRQAPSSFHQKLGRYRNIDYKKYERDIENDMEGNNYIKLDANAGFEHMSWLWSSCVVPILEEVKNSQASDSNELLRVWWIGTGIASSFPFHAAGRSIKDFENSQDSENTLSQIVPSYTPTIKALSYARSCASRAAKINSSEASILVVTMPSTPEHQSLPGVEKEKLAIQKITTDICKIKALESPMAEHVLNSMSGFDIVHFACHGCADPEDPSNSHLLLQKSGSSGAVVDKLTVSDISNKNTLGKTWIVYLSACSTAGVEATSLADECLHIASAFQVAGFAHVIGSLCPADDNICVRVAESFYRSLTKTGTTTRHSNRAVAEALRNAILEIRSESPDPRLWAPFIHSGA